MKVFTCIKNNGLSNLIQTALSGIQDLEVFDEENSSNLILTISITGEPDVLIIDEPRVNELNLTELETISNKIIFSNNTEFKAEGWSNYHTDQWEDVIKSLISTKPLAENEFAGFPFKILSGVDTPICDIFIEIKKNGVPHHLKLIKAGDKTNQEQIEHYINKGVKYAKILTEEKTQFLNSVSNDLYMQMQKGFSPDVAGQSLDTSIMMLKDIGFNSTSTQLIEGVVQTINETLDNKKDENVKIITNLLNSKASSYYKKAHMISMLAIQILKKEKWATRKHEEIITYLTLLADVTLSEPEMLFITTKEELDASNLSEEQKQTVWSHSRDAFDLIQNFKDCPIETDLLVLEHHGNKNGIGFSETLSQDLSKITIIYRVTEDFVIELLKCRKMNKDIKLHDIFGDMYKKHDKKVLHLLLDSLKACFF